MTRRFRPMRRVAITVAVPIALAVAAPAQAVITTSTITSPANNSTQLVTGVGPTFTPAALTVSGTSNGTTGDMIHIRAYRGTAPLAYDAPGADVAVESDGDWSTSIPNGQDASTLPYGGATLYAVPPGAPAALPDSADFQPVRVTGERRVTAVYSGLPADFWFIHTGTQGFFDAYGIADCSVCDTAVYDSATHSRGNYLWYGAGIYNTNDDYGTPRGYLRVDGRNTVFPSGIRNGDVLAGNAGLEPVSVAFTGGAEPSVTDVEPALRCTNATPFPPGSNTDCGTLIDTGVRDSMTVQSANGGRRQIVTHRFSSTDGATHQVDAQLTAYVNIPSAGNQQFQMQWLPDGFALPTGGDTFPAPPGPGTVLFRQNKNVPNGSMEFPIGAMTMSPAPQFIQFEDEDPAREFIMPYRATVSPGRDFVVNQQFDTEPSLALAQAAGAAARARLTPPAVQSQPPATVVIPPDAIKPKLTLSRVPSKVKLKVLRKSGISVRATCDEACALDASLFARVRRATLARAGDLTLGTKRAKRGTGTRRLRLKVSRRLRSSLRRGRKVRVSVTATDAAGNRSTKTKTVRIR